MGPLAAAAAVMTVGSLVQLYNSEKTRKANQQVLDEIKDAFDAIKPPDYDIPIDAPPQLHKEKLSSPEFSGPAAAPKFNMAALSPKMIQMIGQYNPQVAKLVKEAAPTTIQNTQDMKTGRAAQLSALRKFSQIGEGSFDPEYQEMVQRASQKAGADAESRQQSIIQDAQRRGISGSGLELATQIASGANSMNATAAANQNAATQAYRNRLSALASGADLGGSMRNQDINMQNLNAGIINDFNRRMTANAQDWEYNRANAMNNAQLFNLETAQGIENANTATANNYALNQQGRNDDLIRYLYETGLDERDRMDNLKKYDYDNQSKERDYANWLATQNYLNQQGIIDKKNDLKSLIYNNAMNKAAGRSNLDFAQIGMNNQSAADRNNAIQGATNAATTYFGGQANAQNAQNAEVGKANRMQYSRTGQWMTPEEQTRYRNNMNLTAQPAATSRPEPYRYDSQVNNYDPYDPYHRKKWDAY